MTDRLDRIESLLLSTAERLDSTSATLADTNVTLDRVAAQQEQNTRDIDNLLGAISATDVEVRRLGEAVAANETRFNILISEMRADRRASQQSFQALLLSLAGLNGRVDDLEQAS